MFLDDELLQIGRQTKLTERSLRKAKHKMLSACLKNLNKAIENDKSVETFNNTLIRIKKTWQIVADKLKNENRGFINKDDLKKFLYTKF